MCMYVKLKEDSTYVAVNGCHNFTLNLAEIAILDLLLYSSLCRGFTLSVSLKIPFDIMCVCKDKRSSIFTI